jgi:small GTP-binding protein
MPWERNTENLAPRNKIIFIGEAGVGKSSLIHRFYLGKKSTPPGSTTGMAYSTTALKIDGEILPVEIWDTGGHARFHSFMPLYIQGADVIVACYDVKDMWTQQRLQNVWLPLVKKTFSSTRPPIVVVGNKIDLIARDNYETAEAEIEALAVYAEMGKDDGCLFTSATMGENVESLFYLLGRIL